MSKDPWEATGLTPAFEESDIKDDESGVFAYTASGLKVRPEGMDDETWEAIQEEESKKAAKYARAMAELDAEDAAKRAREAEQAAREARRAEGGSTDPPERYIPPPALPDDDGREFDDDEDEDETPTPPPPIIARKRPQLRIVHDPTLVAAAEEAPLRSRAPEEAVTQTQVVREVVRTVHKTVYREDPKVAQRNLMANTSAVLLVSIFTLIVLSGLLVVYWLGGFQRSSLKSEVTVASVIDPPEEICDDEDNDGDGSVDEGLDAYHYYLDADGDNYFDENSKVSCDPNADFGKGWSQQEYSPSTLDFVGDCDDNNPDVYPGAPETVVGRDSNCDGVKHVAPAIAKAVVQVEEPDPTPPPPCKEEDLPEEDRLECREGLRFRTFWIEGKALRLQDITSREGWCVLANSPHACAQVSKKCLMNATDLEVDEERNATNRCPAISRVH